MTDSFKKILSSGSAAAIGDDSRFHKSPEIVRYDVSPFLACKTI